MALVRSNWRSTTGESTPPREPDEGTHAREPKDT